MGRTTKKGTIELAEWDGWDLPLPKLNSTTQVLLRCVQQKRRQRNALPTINSSMILQFLPPMVDCISVSDGEGGGGREGTWRIWREKTGCAFTYQGRVSTIEPIVQINRVENIQPSDMKHLLEAEKLTQMNQENTAHELDSQHPAFIEFIQRFLEFVLVLGERTK